ncbi:DUF4269 domain-containing protein [Flavobacterium psychroterrae]|uniref:DUF4269 domain-containing protein n=1 Tax=Flavobacterium psychroterrae TaxID=2133767 RepID=A0ABS5PIG2_9FLAO|nr:DUF4269 domain-containing protein [Flavobacterium psychroterrae]MBS7234099.1 DUF4269 domain-containing protein [Flavobacterium psychroterrae]
MDIDFHKLEYLKAGTNRQILTYNIITNNKIFLKLKKFEPFLAGTIPINIDIESSDIDIICYYDNKIEFINTITKYFKIEKGFNCKEIMVLNEAAIVATFVLENFEIEIFGQNIPIRQQFAYRHLIIENNLLIKFGEEFRQNVIRLKKQGIKTEPAFAILLGLEGDAYTELLKLENKEEIGDSR